jgi:GGDEF domain-containing protein
MARLMLTFRENVAMLRTSRDEALTDVLTGLGNRRALARELACLLPDARRREADRARAVRPRRLQALQRHLRPSGRRRAAGAAGREPGDVPERPRARFRMGGDEFCALFEPGDEVADPIIAGAASALTEHGEGFNVTSSYGAIVLPREAQDATERCGSRPAHVRAEERGRTSATRQSKDVLVRA